MPTGYEVDAYRSLSRIASSLANIEETLDRIVRLMETPRSQLPTAASAQDAEKAHAEMTAASRFSPSGGNTK